MNMKMYPGKKKMTMMITSGAGKAQETVILAGDLDRSVGKEQAN